MMASVSLLSPFHAPTGSYAPTAPRSPSTEIKVELLQTFFAAQAPTPEDRVPVLLEDGRLYQFRPHYFLGAVTNNFLGGRISEPLTHEQKRALFAIEWVAPWLENVVRVRAENSHAAP